MADNIDIKDATNTTRTVSADEASSGLVQRVKITYSADGGDTHVPADASGLAVKAIDAISGSASNLSTASNSAVTWAADGKDSMVVYIVTGTTGSVIFEATVNGTNWFTHPMAVQIGNPDLHLLAAFTPTTGTVFRLNVNGFHSTRIRVTSTLGAAVSVYSVRSPNVSYIKGADMAPPPHNFGYAMVNKCAQYTSAQTGTALWTPASGKRLAITSVQIQGYGTTAGTAILWFGGSADTTYTIGTDAAIFDGEFAQSATNKPGVVMTPPVPFFGAVDFVLRVTTTNAQSVRFNVWGYEV